MRSRWIGKVSTGRNDSPNWSARSSSSIWSSTYVCLGRLIGFDREFLELADADLHDFRDSPATREVYVYDSVRLGIRRNRARVLLASPKLWPSRGMPTSWNREAGFPSTGMRVCRFSL